MINTIAIASAHLASLLRCLCAISLKNYLFYMLRSIFLFSFLSFLLPSFLPFFPPLLPSFYRCFHPNVDQHGNICLDILKEKWSAAYSVKTILISLQSLLGEPNNDSPLNVQAANLWDDEATYKELLHRKYKEHAASSGAATASA
jgi:hypothetical protein